MEPQSVPIELTKKKVIHYSHCVITALIPSSRLLLEELIIAYSDQAVNVPYPIPVESSQHTIYFNIILQYTTTSPKWSLPFMFFGCALYTCLI